MKGSKKRLRNKMRKRSRAIARRIKEIDNDLAEFALWGWRSTFQQSGSVTCVLKANTEIIYCNPAWDTFALSNHGERATGRCVLGHSIYEYIPSVLESHYKKLIGAALGERKIGASDYQCNSPDLFRSYRLLLLPIPETDLLAMVHFLRLEQTMFDKGVPAANYHSSGPAVVMCAECRRTKREDGDWDWVPEYLKSPPPRVSHAICQDCMLYVQA
jgi:hypothetical protein